MGLGLLLFGLMAGGSAIKCGIENAKMMILYQTQM